MARLSKNPKTIYRRELYARNRAELIKQLGGRCEKHGKDCDGELEFHHPFGRDWNPEDTSRLRRLARYKSEATLGLVTLRCRFHNASDAKNHWSVPGVPF